MGKRICVLRAQPDTREGLFGTLLDAAMISPSVKRSISVVPAEDEVSEVSMIWLSMIEY